MSGFVISGAEVVGGGAGEVFVDGDRIAERAPEGAERIDGAGLVLAPAIVDVGAFAVDADASIAGGIVRVGLMPDGARPLDEPGPVQRAALAAKPRLWVHPIAAATKGLEGRTLAEIGLMKAAGARAVATGRGWISDSGVMAAVLGYAAAHGLAVIAHAEDGGLAAGAVATAGAAASRLGLASAPAIAEAMAIARDVRLAALTGGRLHVRVVSTAAGLEVVREAKRSGLAVTCGTTPAHFLLNDEAIADFRSFARVSPPLRDEADRRAVIEGIGDGTVDMIGSGHDPQGPEDKRLPFADAAPGGADAEHLLPLSLTLVRDGVIGMDRLFELLAAAPSRLLGLDGGRIEAGRPADLILFDAEAPWQIGSARMVARAGNTPFDGLPVQGRVRMVMKGGRRLA